MLNANSSSRSIFRVVWIQWVLSIGLPFATHLYAAPPPSLGTPPNEKAGPSKDIDLEPIGKQELKGIPKTPSTPVAPGRPGFTEVFNCDRYFIFEGKRYVCDSYMRKDAEKLRPLFEGVPEAISELNTYQKNRREIRLCAYIGTVGLLSWFSAGIFKDNGFVVADGTVHKLMTFGGLGIAATSFFYGFAITQRNEAHIGSAIQYYNNAKPDRPIQLEFTTGFDL